MTTKEEIIALAEECGMATAPGGNGYWDNAAQMEAFYHAARKPLEEEIDWLKSSRGLRHIQELRQQLAAAQAREVKLREALNKAADKFHDYAELHSMKERTRDNIEKIERNLEMARMCDKALTQPTDTTALEAIVEKAGEVMRERAATLWLQCSEEEEWNLEEAIRALPPVTLEDLK